MSATPSMAALTRGTRQFTTKVARASDILRQDGLRALAQRATRIAYDRLDVAGLAEPPSREPWLHS